MIWRALTTATALLTISSCDIFTVTTSKPGTDAAGKPAGSAAMCDTKSHERKTANQDEALATDFLCGDGQNNFGYHVRIGMEIERRHSQFDDRRFDHLAAGMMLLICGELCKEGVDPMPIGMLQWFARKIEPSKMSEGMGDWSMDGPNRDALVERVSVAAKAIRDRAANLDARRVHMYVEVPNQVRDLREAYFKQHASLYQRLDAMLGEVTAAKGGKGDAGEVSGKLDAIRGDYLAECKAADCRFDPLVVEVTREMTLLNVAIKNDHAALAEWDLFRDKAPYRNAYAATVHLALYLAMKAETESNAAYTKMKNAGADEATLKARFGDPPPIKVTPGGAFEGSESPPNLTAGLDSSNVTRVTGIVKKVSKGKVLFQDNVSSYDLTDCVDTRRVAGIDLNSGRLVYEQRCRTVGKKVEREKIAPVTVPPAEASKLRPKEELTALVTKDGRTGYVLRARNKDGKLVQLRGHRLDPKKEREPLFRVVPEE